MLDYIMEYGAYKIQGWMRALRQNPDKTMLHAAEEALKFSETLPNSDYYIPERTPDLTARGNGKPCDTESIAQFGNGSLYAQEETSTH